MNTTRLSWRTSALSLLLASASIVSFAAVATPKPPGLLSNQPGKVQVELPQQALFGRSNAVKINYGRLRSGRFFVELPGDVSFEAIRDVEYDFGDGKSAWVGHANGNAKDRVVIGQSGNALSATFAVGDRLFKLEPRANGSHVISEVKPTDPAPELDPIPVADVAGTGSTSADTGAAADGAPIIDVLVAYTPRVVAKYGVSGAEALVVQAVAEANQAYANSGVNARLNLVQAVQTDYVESGDMPTDLSRLRSTNDGFMDELHSLRDSYGADLVSLIEHEPAYCGYAYRMSSLSAGFASSAFSVVHHSCATGYYSFAHELGHNQGAHHDPDNASGAIYSYAYGYQEPFNSFRTVMAYNCSGGCKRVSQFSNPDILYNGQPTGTSGNNDNTRTLNNTAATVASFRAGSTQTAPPPAKPGSLDAMAASSSTIQLSWTDNSSDESGFRLERSDDGVNFSEIASLPANSSSYSDDSLAADTIYNYRARAWNSAGSSGYTNVASAATEGMSAYSASVAITEFGLRGTRNGSYRDTAAKDGIIESITEKLAGTTPNQYGMLQQKWTFSVEPGDSMTFAVEANTDTNTDSFTFAYSTDRSNWVDMFGLDSSSSGELQFALPAGISGDVYIRVKDNVRVKGELTSHTIYVDHMVIRSTSGTSVPPPPSPTAPSAPSGPSASAMGQDSISIGWKDTADNEEGFTIDRQKDGSTQWQQAGTAKANATSFVDSNLTAGTLYRYRVNAFNAAGVSTYSATVAAETEAASGTGTGTTGQIDLNANGYKIKGRQNAAISWSGATGTKVDIYRDGAKIVSTNNDGAYTDAINRKGGGSYIYKLCEAGTSTCSGNVSVVF